MYDEYELIVDRLKQEDEVTILELLEINADELVDRFMDKLEDKLEYLEHQLND